MKCTKCKEELPEKKVRELEVELSNPGKIKIKGKIRECACGSQYADHEDMMDLARKFDKAHAK